MDVNYYNILLLKRKMWAFHWRQPPLSHIRIINNIIEEVAKTIVCHIYMYNHLFIRKMVGVLPVTAQYKVVAMMER
jgi:hypothetical protein